MLTPARASRAALRQLSADVMAAADSAPEEHARPRQTAADPILKENR